MERSLFILSHGPTLKPALHGSSYSSGPELQILSSQLPILLKSLLTFLAYRSLLLGMGGEWVKEMSNAGLAFLRMPIFVTNCHHFDNSEAFRHILFFGIFVQLFFLFLAGRLIQNNLVFPLITFFFKALK